MNEIPTIPPTIDPQPFEPGARKTAGGCQKPLLIGCGALALLLGIGAIVMVLKAKDVLAFAMGKLQAEVVANLPADYPVADRERLEASFDRTMTKIRNGEIDPAALQKLQGKLTAAVESAATRKLTTAEAADLQSALDAFCEASSEGSPPPGPAAAPETPAGDATAPGVPES